MIQNDKVTDIYTIFKYPRKRMPFKEILYGSRLDTPENIKR